MNVITDVTSALPGIPIEHLIAVLALGAFALSGFAIYAVFVLARGKRK